MGPEATTRERLRAIEGVLDTHGERLDEITDRQDGHSGELSDLKKLAAQNAVVTRAIETAISGFVEAGTSSARWIRRTCGIVGACAIVAAGAIVYRLLR